MTCSPDQATFTNAAKVTDDYVEELDYAVSMDYAQGMYDSCKDVSNPTTGLSLINFTKNYVRVGTVYNTYSSIVIS